MSARELDILAMECPLHLPAMAHENEARIHEVLWDGIHDSVCCVTPEESTNAPHTTRQHLYSHKIHKAKAS